MITALAVVGVAWLVVSVLLHRSLTDRRTTTPGPPSTIGATGAPLLLNRTKQPPSAHRTTTSEASSEEC